MLNIVQFSVEFPVGQSFLILELHLFNDELQFMCSSCLQWSFHHQIWSEGCLSEQCCGSRYFWRAARGVAAWIFEHLPSNPWCTFTDNLDDVWATWSHMYVDCMGFHMFSLFEQNLLMCNFSVFCDIAIWYYFQCLKISWLLRFSTHNAVDRSSRSLKWISSSWAKLPGRCEFFHTLDVWCSIPQRHRTLRSKFLGCRFCSDI